MFRFNHSSTKNITELLAISCTLLVCTQQARANPPAHAGTDNSLVAMARAEHKANTIRVGKNGTVFSIFTQDFDYVVGAGEQILLGMHGTILSDDKSGYQLHNGRLLVDTGKAGLLLMTALGKIQIDPDTTAVVDASRPGFVNLSVVGGVEAAGLTFFPYCGDSAQKLKLGEALTAAKDNNHSPLEVSSANTHLRESIDKLKDTLANAQLSGEEKLKQAESCKRILQQAQELLSVKTTLGSIDLEQHWRCEHDFPTDLVLAFAHARGQGQRIVSHIKASNASSPAFLLGSVQTGKIREFEAKGLVNAYASSGTEFGLTDSGSITLKRGALLLNNEGGCAVQTEVGTARAVKDSLWCVEHEPGIMRIKQCTGMDGLSLQLGRNRISMHAGQEVSVIQGKPTTAQAAPNDGIGRRKLCFVPLGSDKTAVIGDFSLMSMMTNTEYSKYLRMDSAKRSDRAVQRILKASAAINIAQAGRGRYLTYDGKTSSIPEGLFCDTQAAQ